MGALELCSLSALVYGPGMAEPSGVAFALNSIAPEAREAVYVVGAVKGTAAFQDV